MADDLSIKGLGLNNSTQQEILKAMLNRDNSKPIRQEVKIDGADKVIRDLETIYGLSENVAKSLANIYKTGKNNRANKLFDFKDDAIALQKMTDAYNDFIEAQNRGFKNQKDRGKISDFLSVGSVIKAGRGNLDIIPKEISTLFEQIYKETTARSGGEKYAYSVTNFKNLINALQEAQQDNINLVVNELLDYLRTNKTTENKIVTKKSNKFHNVNYKDLFEYNEDELVEYFDSINELYEEAVNEYARISSKYKDKETIEKKLSAVTNKINVLKRKYNIEDSEDIDPYKIADKLTKDDIKKGIDANQIEKELRLLESTQAKLFTALHNPDSIMSEEEVNKLGKLKTDIKRFQEQLYGIYMIAETLKFNPSKFTKDPDLDLQDAKDNIVGIIRNLFDKDIAPSSDFKINQILDMHEEMANDDLLNSDFRHIKEIIQSLIQDIVESKLVAFEKFVDEDLFIETIRNGYGSDKINGIINDFKIDKNNNIFSLTIEEYYQQMLQELDKNGLLDIEEYAKVELGKFRSKIKDENKDEYDDLAIKFIDEKVADLDNLNQINKALAEFYDSVISLKQVSPLQEQINSILGNGYGNFGEGDSFNNLDGDNTNPEDYSRILNILEKIYEVFKDIANTTSLLSKSIGIITEDNGYNSLLETLREVNEYFQNIKDAVFDISSRDLSPTLNIQANQSGDTYSIRKRAQRYKENYENAFNVNGYKNLF